MANQCDGLAAFNVTTVLTASVSPVQKADEFYRYIRD